jgi:hypothetical protein
VLIALVAALATGGCFLALAAFPPPIEPSPSTGGSGIEGEIRIGRAGATASLALLSAAPIATSSFLAAAAPLTGLGDVPPVTPATASPLTAEGGATYRTQAGGSGTVYVEAVDLADGSRHAIARADGAGRFKLPLAAPAADRALAIQATFLASGQVTGFLAACTVQPNGKSQALRVDVTPGSTAIALASARLAGVGPELVANNGFRAFAAAKLRDLVLRTGASASAGAAAILDGAEAFTGAGSYETLLGRVVRSATALAQATLEKAGTDTPAQGAALDLILAKAAALEVGPTARPQDILTTAAVTVTPAAIAEAKATPGP